MDFTVQWQSAIQLFANSIYFLPFHYSVEIESANFLLQHRPTIRYTLGVCVGGILLFLVHSIILLYLISDVIELDRAWPAQVILDIGILLPTR